MLHDDSYYCYCGHIIYDDWNYCPACGRPTKRSNMEWSDEDDYYYEP
jgi:uncharacterized OB-fold protein